jgi:hypothetical protein
MLVEQHASAASPTRAAPANVERYGDEVRETFLDRIDKLTFRVDDGGLEHRFFENGRPDKVKQILENRKLHTRQVLYSLRSDGCTEFTRERDQSSGAVVYRATFADRSDGVTAILLALRAGNELDVSVDSAVSLIREKMLHAAVRFNADVSLGRVAEAYQDQDARELRVTVRDDAFGKKTNLTFSNDQPTEDPRYEAAKVAIMKGMKQVVALERELFVNVFPFVASDTTEDMIAKQRERLYALSNSLFAAFDEVSSVIE